MSEGEQFATNLPPVAAIFIGSTWFTVRPRVLSTLPRGVQQRIRCIRYQPHDHFENAFSEELQQALGELSQLLEPGDVGISVLCVAELQKPIAEFELAQLIQRAMPPSVSHSVLWLGQHVPSGESIPLSINAILLSSVWRGGRLEGGALEEAYRILVLCFLTTTRSRFRESNFETFSGVRFPPSTRHLLCSVETTLIDDFKQKANEQLHSSVNAHYFPLISDLAARRAREHAAADPRRLLQLRAIQTVLELQIAEPLLCAAVAEAGSLDESRDRLVGWQQQSSEPVRDLLAEWGVTFQRWQNEAALQTSVRADVDVARKLFDSYPFPPLSRFVGKIASQKARAAWECAVQQIARELATRKRAQLDAEHYNFLPSDSGPTQRARSIMTAFVASAAKNAFVTRHFTVELLRDLRDEISRVPDRSITLYWLQTE